MRLLHKGESLCCFRDLTSVTYGGMLPSDLTLSALRFILSATSEQSCKQDLETVDVCNSLSIFFVFLLLFQRICEICRKIRLTKVPRDLRKSSERFKKKFREISKKVPRDLRKSSERFKKKFREISENVPRDFLKSMGSFTWLFFSLFTSRKSFPSMNLVIDSRTRSAARLLLQNIIELRGRPVFPSFLPNLVVLQTSPMLNCSTNSFDNTYPKELRSKILMTNKYEMSGCC